MEHVKYWLEETFGWSPCSVWLAAGSVAIVGIASFLLYRRISRTSRDDAFPTDVLVVHKFTACATTPGASPFSTKLETYLRLAEIPYKTVCDNNVSTKGKMPWVSHNGLAVSDSQFCIEYLNKTFKVDLNRGMSDTDRGVARAMRVMAEESLYWYLLLDRWHYRSDCRWIGDIGVPWIIGIVLSSRFSKMAYAAGMGRHTKDEVVGVAISDVRALSAQLGDRPFMFGCRPVEEDCAIFGQLTSVFYSLYGGAVSNYIKHELPNLVAYCERMKAWAWPDWDECLLKLDN